MKTLIVGLIFICCSIITKAQFAIIKDKDGFVNVRKEPNVKSPVVGKLYTGDIFGLEDDDEHLQQWVKIYRQDADQHILEGYIYKNRFISLDSYKSTKKTRVYKDSCVAQNEDVSVTIKSAPFNLKKHKLFYSKADKSANIASELVKIDGKPFWGTDGEIPKKALASLKVIVHGVHVTIPDDAFDDLYEPCFETLTVYFGPDNILYITMENSDGAGGYSVVWVIKDGKYLKRYIDNFYA